MRHSGAEVRGDRREQLRLRARLEAVAVAAAGLDDVVDDDALLVDLDREDAAEDVAVAVLVDGAREGVVQVGDGGREDLREADDHRRRDAAQRDLVDDLLQRDAAGGLARRPDDEVAVVGDVEEALAPVRDPVERGGLRVAVARVPRPGGAGRTGSFQRTCARHGAILEQPEGIATKTRTIPVVQLRLRESPAGRRTVSSTRRASRVASA